MKKILIILIISLLWPIIGLAKISDEYYNIIYEGCLKTAEKKNRGPSATKRYCICSAEYINRHFTDNSLDELLKDGADSKAANDFVNNVSNFCNRKVGS